MTETIQGKIFIAGDNIDTDQIIPAQYLNLVPTKEEEYKKLGSYALSGLPETYPPFVESGCTETAYSIVIAGRNFGCGSSREHAPISLGAAGVKAVVAESFARIFFRNCISTGELFPVESTHRLVDHLQTGMEASLDLDNANLKISESSESYTLHSLGDAQEVISEGGLFPYARRQGMF